MKNGILTFVGTQSHGACLQAYALKEAIYEIGEDAEIINYHCARIDAVKTDKFTFKGKNIKQRIGTVLKYNIYKERFSKFENFEKEHLKLKKNVSREEMDALYDKIIVGSDQVWNTDITGNDYTFFLDNISDNKKKLSYAASLGTDVFKNDVEEKCFALVSDFSEINVREERLKQYLSGRIKKEISCVIDPTQLISREKWSKLAGDSPLESEKYMFVHAPLDNSSEWGKIYRIANERNLKIVYLTNKIYKKKNCKCLYAVSPTEYLNYIRFADYVVTGSFHTLSFSLIFERAFLCTDSMVKGRNSRLTNLLEISGCSDRMTGNFDKVWNSETDYKSVNEKLSIAVEYSKNKLIEMLK